MFESEREYDSYKDLSLLASIASDFVQHEDFTGKSEQTSLVISPTQSKAGKFRAINYAKPKRSEKYYTRVIVYVRKDSKALYVPADFIVCLFDYFEVDPNRAIMVECFIENDCVFLQPQQEERKAGEEPVRKLRKNVYRLEHPVFCAVHRLEEAKKKTLPIEIAQRGMDVGVSVVLESADGKLLLTRRAYHMRTFPGVWVPPGGHIEKGEDFSKAGFREVREEVGLEIFGDVHCSILGLWESVFPALLYEGDPRRHHLVVYLSVTLPQTSKELQKLLKLEPEEVDATMWLSEGLVSFAIEAGVPGTQLSALRIPITMVNLDRSCTPGLLDPKVLRKKMPAPGRIIERLTTGTRYALKLWLQRKKRDEE